jgi:hypothetical protein
MEKPEGMAVWLSVYRWRKINKPQWTGSEPLNRTNRTEGRWFSLFDLAKRDAAVRREACESVAIALDGHHCIGQCNEYNCCLQHHETADLVLSCASGAEHGQNIPLIHGKAELDAFRAKVRREALEEVVNEYRLKGCSQMFLDYLKGLERALAAKEGT